MTFTTTVPTKPGSYAWKKHLDYRHYSLVQVKFIFGNLRCFSCSESNQTLEVMGGLWCRLVTADEVEKAYVEGYKTCVYQGGMIEPLELEWQQSRARKVSEGIE